MLTKAKHSMILGRGKGSRFRNGQERRQRSKERGRGREGQTGSGMMEGPSYLSPRNRSELELNTSALYSPKPLPLAVPGPLASSLIHLDEQILDILDLTLHRLSPLPQLPVACLQPLALALQGLALCPLPLAVPQSR